MSKAPVPLARMGHSPAEAALMIGCGRTKLFELIKAGALRSRKLGRLTIVEAESIHEFFQRLPPARPAPDA